VPLPQNPTIMLHLTGLLVFCFGKRNKHCQVGIHSSTDDHELRLSLVKRVSDPATGSEQTLASGTISHVLVRDAMDLWLNVEGSPSPKQRTAEPYIAGDPAQPPVDPQDFRHVIDLEGEHFYNRPLKVKEGVLTPSLFITQGLFYSGSLSSNSYHTVPVVPDGSGHTHEHTGTGSTATGHSLGKIAEFIGVNIYLDHPNQAAVLRVGGKRGQELLRLKREENTIYEITIDNGPTEQAPPGSHFGHYYEAFELKPGEPKILIEAEGITVLSDSTGLCESIQLSRSDSLG
jgi:hypothetical protein